MLYSWFNSSLAPCTLRFACNTWRPGKASGYKSEGGTRWIIGVTWTNMAICGAWTEFGCNGITAHGFVMPYEGGKYGWLIVARATMKVSRATTTSPTTVDWVSLDLTINWIRRNWKLGNSRNHNWDNAWLNQNDMDLRIQFKMLLIRWLEEVMS